MTRKGTPEELNFIFKNRGYELIKTYYKKYNNQKAMFSIFRDVNGYTYKMRVEYFVAGYTPRVADKGNEYSLQNISLWLYLNKKIFKLKNNNTYSGNNNKLWFKCVICKESFDMTWHNLMANQNCPYCSGRRAGKKENLKITNPELLKEWNYYKNKIKPEEVKRGTNKKVWWQCRKCSHEWKSFIYSRAIDRKGCPKCNTSKGELLLCKILNELGIFFIQQKTFNDCVYKRKLPFDFYVPKYDTCIEYDGVIHYEDRFNNEKEFKLIKIRDEIKTNYCKNKNIGLIRIPYWEINNMKKIVEEKLLKGGN